MKSYVWVFTVFLLLAFSSAAFAERLTVNVNLANVRSGPETGSKILWKVEKYHPIEVIKTQGEWYYFQDFEGDKGWIHRDIVSKEPSVIAIKDKCNVRSGPGPDHNIIFTVERGVPFREIEQNGEWIHIRHADGDEGWLHKSLVW
ncbi:MAG: SH3 domain-containing protein [Desulfococcaceae bacterium]